MQAASSGGAGPALTLTPSVYGSSVGMGTAEERAWLVNEGLGYVMGNRIDGLGGRERRAEGQAISTCIRSAGLTVPVPFSPRPGPQFLGVWVLGLLGLGLGTVGRQTVLLSSWASHPCRPVFPEWSQVLGLSRDQNQISTVFLLVQRQQRSRCPTRHRSARGPSSDLWRFYAYCCKMI